METSSRQPEPQIQPNPKHKLSWVLVTALILVIAAGGILYFVYANQSSQTAVTDTVSVGTNTTGTADQTTDSAPAASSTSLKNDSDLQSASADLDSSDVDSIDTTLSQNDTDSSQF